jgi:hypothetical protein
MTERTAAPSNVIGRWTHGSHNGTSARPSVRMHGTRY